MKYLIMLKYGYESKHNLKYWNGEEYLGFGTAAASYILDTRYTNVASIQEYIKGINENISVIANKEELDSLDKIKEYIILRLRLKEGLNIEEFKRKFNRDIHDLYKIEIDQLIKNNLLKEEHGWLHLTYKGEDIANQVWSEFI